MFKKLASTRSLVMLATLTAIGFALSFLEFPIFPAADFLKFDFSTFTTMFGGYMFGPLGAIIIEGIKQLLIFGTHTTTAGVGQLANFIVNTAFAIVPSTLYLFKKGIPWVIAGMFVGCALQVAVSLPVNRYINFPLFMGAGAGAAFAKFWPYVLGFNAIKSVAISILVFVLYKRLSFLIKRYVLTPRAKSSAPAAETAAEPVTDGAAEPAAEPANAATDGKADDKKQ